MVRGSNSALVSLGDRPDLYPHSVVLLLCTSLASRCLMTTVAGSVPRNGTRRLVNLTDGMTISGF